MTERKMIAAGVALLFISGALGMEGLFSFVFLVLSAWVIVRGSIWYLNSSLRFERQQRERLLTALGNTGIFGPDGPLPVVIKTDADRQLGHVRIQVKLPSASLVSVADLVKYDERIADALGVGRLRITRAKPGVAEFSYIVEGGMAAAPLLHAGGPVGTPSVYIGTTYDGQPLFWRPDSDAAHILVQGASGGGKSTFLRSMFANLAPLNMASGGLELSLVDFKGSLTGEFRHLVGVPGSLVAATASRPTEIVAEVRRLSAELHRRRNLTEENFGVEWGSIREQGIDDGKRIILVVDEFSSLLEAATHGIDDPKEAKAVAKEVTDFVTLLAQVGRSMWIHGIFSLQRADISGSAMTGNARSNMAGRVLLPGASIDSSAWDFSFSGDEQPSPYQGGRGLGFVSGVAHADGRATNGVEDLVVGWSPDINKHAETVLRTGQYPAGMLTGVVR